ncbi:MAG: TolC family protein [Paucibacter sp.]|nr:TolC family protein [Roseateles sp.]
MKELARLTAAPALVLALGGCAGFSADGGMGEVARLTQARTGHSVAQLRSRADAEAVQARIDALLAAPLSADGVVELALLGNQGLQARLGDVGLAEADAVQAGRPRNPALSLGRLAGAGTLEIDRGVLVSLLDLLTLPQRRETAGLRFERARYAAAAEAVATAREAQLAYFDAVAAQQLAAYARQVVDAADASGELAQRMAAAGNLSRLDQLREQAFHADAQAALAQREHDAVRTRERLARALGLTGVQLARVQLPDRLPDLPDAAPAALDAEQAAVRQRLDIRMARLDADVTARELGLSEVAGFVNVLDVGWQDKSVRGAPAQSGATLSVELPLFDFGGTARSRARTAYEQALHHAASVAVNALSELREAQSRCDSAYALARHYRDEVLPLRQRISEENLRRYNGMLIDVFELLADARGQISAVSDGIGATRDFWVARTRLQSAIDGGDVNNPKNEGGQP